MPRRATVASCLLLLAASTEALQASRPVLRTARAVPPTAVTMGLKPADASANKPSGRPFPVASLALGTLLAFAPSAAHAVEPALGSTGLLAAGAQAVGGVVSGGDFVPSFSLIFLSEIGARHRHRTRTRPQSRPRPQTRPRTGTKGTALASVPLGPNPNPNPSPNPSPNANANANPSPNLDLGDNANRSPSPNPKPNPNLEPGDKTFFIAALLAARTSKLLTFAGCAVSPALTPAPTLNPNPGANASPNPSPNPNPNPSPNPSPSPSPNSHPNLDQGALALMTVISVAIGQIFHAVPVPRASASPNLNPNLNANPNPYSDPTLTLVVVHARPAY